MQKNIKQNHIKDIDKNILKLQKVLERNVYTNKINAVISSILSILFASANSLEGKIKPNRNVTYEDYNDWLNLMVLTHQIFLSSIHSAFEEELDLLILKKDLNNTIKPSMFKDVMKELNEIKGNKLKVKKIKSKLEEKSFISFNDKLNSILKISKLNKNSKKEWRNYFESLRILRNKSSHSSPKLKPSEIKILNASGFATSKNDYVVPKFNTNYYPEICENLYKFLSLFQD